ncbi:hypothetical protein [Flavobacterium sp. NRK F7]|uniref:hypothetical protein n=1 Tax=Flavobacterium sp. NRK F7 TaxID=2954930 RepID=UPI0020908DFE|nr:hypothetical protein [Flavobacterium sp. NRK F7]MCO6163848.1 hypothetical protein [Flavobacterium sp. NRK F7]
MKKYIYKSLFFVLTLVLMSCNNDDDSQSIWLPVNMEIIYPASAASYQTLDISYTNEFLIQNVTRNLSGGTKISYDCAYNDLQLLSNLKITDLPSGEETNYQISYTNGIVTKITVNPSGAATEYNIDYDSNSNLYRYNFPYTWKFNAENNFEYYFFSSDKTLQVTYESGNGFNHFMKSQPALAILDSYFRENFFQDLYFLSTKPVKETRFEDLVSSDVIESHFTHTFDTHNHISKTEIRINTDTNPFLIKNITYQEKKF